MVKHMKRSIYILTALALVLSCAKAPIEAPTSDEMVLNPIFPGVQGKATAAGFESGDQVGIFITKYNAEKPSPLQIGGNVGSNLTLTYNGTSWSLNPKVYWEEGKYDIYGYYPRQDISSVDALPFRVAEKQNEPATQNEMSPYEASDFLWAKVSGATRTGSVPMAFQHKMCKVNIKLIKGEDYEGDLPEDASVFIHNTVTLAYIDLATGDVVKDNREASRTIRAKKVAADRFEAIVVPQRLSNRVPLVEIVCGQVSYLFESTVQFKSGTVHAVTITLSDNPEKVAIDIGGQIENWL